MYAYDEHGNEREWVESDTEGAVPETKKSIPTSMHAHGYWVKQVTAEWIPDGDGGYLEPAEAEYRTITLLHAGRDRGQGGSIGSIESIEVH